MISTCIVCFRHYLEVPDESNYLKKKDKTNWCLRERLFKLAIKVNLVFSVAALFETVRVKRHDALLIGQAHERLDLEVELEHGTSIDVLFDNAVEADDAHKVLVAYEQRVLVDLR